MPTILGIDPGSNITGYAVIDAKNKEKPIAIDFGCISVRGQSLCSKLTTIHQQLCVVIQQHKPEIIAIEQVFVGKNVQSALKLGQARGVAIAAAGMHGLELFEYNPRNIKQAIVGYGAADKTQMQLMVRHLLGIKNNVQADAADALAVALCHAYQPAWLQKIKDKI